MFSYWRPPCQGSATVSPRTPSRLRWAYPALLSVTGCVAYEPAPLDAAALLAELRAVTLESAQPASERANPRAQSGTGVREDPAAGIVAQPQTRGPGGGIGRPPFDPSDGLTVSEATAVAVTLNPALIAERAGLGVAQAQLVAAGVLPDPGVEWDFSDRDLEVFLPLLRPDERDARIDLAQAQLEEVRWGILDKEWELGRDVHLAFLDLLAAAERRRLNEQLEQVAAHTYDVFERARGLGAATALQEVTASIQLADVRLARERLAAEERQARLRMNALLGLPPGAHYELQTTTDPFASVSNETLAPELLVDQAVTRRPDMRALMSAYEGAEQRLRLAVAMQWPEWGIGTRFGFALPLFSRFQRAAVEIATRERERLHLDVLAAVHDLRAEIHGSVAALDLARRQVDYFIAEIEPRIATSLRLTEAAFQARQVTAAEILLAQNQVIDARVRLLDARIEFARALATVGWAAGTDEYEQGVRP